MVHFRTDRQYLRRAYVCGAEQVENLEQCSTCDRWRGGGGSVPGFGSGFALRGMEAETGQFFAHGETRNAEPAGGFGLIALGQFDGAPEKFAFQIVDG